MEKPDKPEAPKTVAMVYVCGGEDLCCSQLIECSDGLFSNYLFCFPALKHISTDTNRTVIPSFISYTTILSQICVLLCSSIFVFNLIIVHSGRFLANICYLQTYRGFSTSSLHILIVSCYVCSYLVLLWSLYLYFIHSVLLPFMWINSWFHHFNAVYCCILWLVLL